MKKIIILFALIFAVFIAQAQNKTVTLGKDLTYIDIPVVAGDSIVESQTYWILINSLQDYPAMQDVYVDLTAVSGSPSVAISLEARKFAGDAWSEIISAATWTSTKVNLTLATANRYRQYKLKFIASGADQKTTLKTVQFKTWFTGGFLSVTSLTDGTATFTNGALTGATTGAFSGAVTIGGALGITGATTAAAITASGLITANGGVTLGSSDHLTGSSTSNIVFNTDKFTVAGATGNTVVAGTLGVTGVTTATGGIAFATGSTVFWAKGGVPVVAATGTDVACSAGDRYWVELEIPHNATITGLSYLVGSVGGTDSVMVHLYNSAGTQVATSKKSGAAHGDIVGTAAELQSVAFTTPYAAVAGKYFAAVQFNGNTAKFRAYLLPGCKFVANTAVGVYDTAVASITPTTSFVVSKGPIIATY